MNSSTHTFTPLNLKECMETVRAKVAEMVTQKTPKTQPNADAPKAKGDDIWSRIED